MPASAGHWCFVMWEDCWCSLCGFGFGCMCCECMFLPVLVTGVFCVFGGVCHLFRCSVTLVILVVCTCFVAHFADFDIYTDIDIYTDL